MFKGPSGTVWGRSRTRFVCWFTAAALAAAAVVTALLLDVLVQGVLASGEAPSQLGADIPRPAAEASATATPALSPDPTPTPGSTPTATPTLTLAGTPEPETVATITALTFIDPDGDPTTNDGHVFDGRWDFSADFGGAEVLSTVPYSDWLESAFWRISYNADRQILITAVSRNGYALRDVECVASHNSEAWDVDGTTVSWFAPAAGPEPVSLHCTFTQTPTNFVPVRGSVEVIKVVDPDADPATDNSVYSDRPFAFTVRAEGADIISVTSTSVDGHGAYFGLAYEGLSTKVVITEVPQDGFELVSARCEDFRFNDVVVPVTVSVDSISFQAIAPSGDVDGQYGCYLTNVRTDASPRMTLPPTDVGGGKARGARIWPPLLLLVIGAAACPLAFGIHQRSRLRGGRRVFP